MQPFHSLRTTGMALDRVSLLYEALMQRQLAHGHHEPTDYRFLDQRHHTRERAHHFTSSKVLKTECSQSLWENPGRAPAAATKVATLYMNTAIDAARAAAAADVDASMPCTAAVVIAATATAAAHAQYA